jgi:hypothetical protein
MNRVRICLILASVASALAFGLVAGDQHAAASGLTTFRVTITNTTAPDTWLTRGAYLLHEEPHAFWQAGGRANQATEDIAEFAITGTAVDQLGATEIGVLLVRGDSLTFEVRAAPGQLLSTVQMFSMTNDAFLGLESLALFDTNGSPTSSTVLLEGWDSGTEANTFAETSYEGASADEPIQLHPDFPGTQAVVTVVPYDALVIEAGGSFKAWTGPERDVVDVFDDIEGVAIVWRWTGSGWQSWSALLPDALREAFILRSGDVLFIATDQLITVPV